MKLLLLLTAGSVLLAAEATSPVGPPAVKPSCGINEEYNECGTECERNCTSKDSDLRCSNVCKAGCFCIPGFVRDDVGRCISKSHCYPQRNCSSEKHEIFQSCGTFCQNTCEYPDGRACTKQCAPGCFCQEGYVRDRDGNCVLLANCPPRQVCDVRNHEIYLECGSACADTCDKRGQVCGAGCVRGCFCQRGYVFNKLGRCVKPEECPKPQNQCGRNQIWSDCGTFCPDTCWNLDDWDRECDDECSAGCFCVDGYVLDDEGNCIHPSECAKPQNQCGRNQIWSDCGTLCPDTCWNRDDWDRECDDECSAGCFCDDGYVFNDDGQCVKPEECAKEVCRQPNEEYLTCGSACPDTCDNYNNSRRGCTRQCVRGCFCKKGYVRGPDGKCIEPMQCPPVCGPHETYQSCGTACPRTCKNKGALIKCIATCKAGCFCDEGYVRNDKGSCVKPEQCPPTNQCTKPNEVFQDCGSSCPNTCANYKDTQRICTLQCVQGCFCIKGFVRQEDGQCVQPDQCPTKCPENEEHKSCGTACQKTCKNKDIKINCIDLCVDGCFCKNGYVRNDAGICVKPDQCPPTNQCTNPNEVFQDCGSSCPNTCANYKETNRNCTRQCVQGCYCKKGFVRREDGQCVQPDQCPAVHNCKKNEVYTSCLIGQCRPKYCTDIGKSLPCPRVRPPCKGGCLCEEGYLRDSFGNCIPQSKCPCPKNEIYNKCFNTCPPETCAAMGKKYFCPFQNASNCKEGCRCLPGYLRNDDGKCIKKQECPCPANEKYNACGTACQRTCKNKDIKINCLDVCVEGCFCVEGYVRNDTGACVKPNQCPPVCGLHETYQSCGTACPRTCKNKGALIKCISACKAGCFCDEGYVRDDSGSCVKPEQCPPTNQCTKPNEVFQDCGSSCPNTCANYKDTQRICTLQCVQGCFCIKGFVRREDGQCVPPDQCRSCPPNERYVDCELGTCVTKTCRQLGQPVACPDIIGPCAGGCICDEGMLRDENGVCVPQDKCRNISCGPNQIYSDCAFNCSTSYCRKSDKPENICTGPYVCNGGCVCKTGYKIDAKKDCIPAENCPAFPCTRPNEEYDSCPNICRNESCAAKDIPPVICNTLIKDCRPDCVCKKGFWRNAEGVCVAKDQCPMSCPTGEIYQECGSLCIATCENRGNPGLCIGGCVAGCFCPNGLYRNDENKCVSYENCTCNGDPNTKPGCGVRCRNTCSDYGKNETFECPLACNLFGCDCREGFIHDDIIGKCVLPQDCTAQCPKGQVYNACGTACPRTCANRGAVGGCTEQCVAGCFCPDDLFRNDKGECVKFEECTCNGDINTRPGCGTHCGNTCKDHAVNASRICPPGCSLYGCDCKKGFVYDEITKRCVLPKDCSPPCGENYEFKKCGTACPETCDDKNTTRPCSKQCVVGCFCKNGYVLDNNKCILKEQCNKQCPANQTLVGCAMRCPTDKCAMDDRPGPICDPPRPCPPGCVCKQGYKLDPFSKERRCILKSDCPQKCPPGEMYNECGSPCPQTCRNKGLPVPPCSPTCVTGCFCTRGQIRNYEGKCVDPDKCPSKGCNGDPNAEMVDCPNPCPRTCKQPTPPKVCTKQCVKQGCQCKPGFFLGPDNKCIELGQCPGNECPANQTYSYCAARCPTDYCRRDNSPKPACSPPYPCPGGCVCKAGYKLDPNSKERRCILEADCPAPCPDGERFNECGPACTQTCANKDLPVPPCVPVCVSGCFCANAQVRNNQGTCVDPNQCPNATCNGDPNAEMVNCPNPCPATCEQPTPPKVCSRACLTQGCQCKKGFVLGPNNKCIELAQCPGKPCGANQTYTTCAWHCPTDDCPNGGPVPQCLPPPPEYCTPGCRCSAGYKQYRSGENVRCIRESDCPPIKCSGKNEISLPCPECHDDSCQGRDQPKRPCAAYTCGLPRCVCKPDFYRDDEGECVPASKCPVRCPKNEEYSYCFAGCPPRTCDSIGREYRCPQQNCSQGCVCLDGYSRDENGVCIPSMECPKAGCASANETFSNCGHECSYCPVDDSPPTTCEPARRPCRPGCVCARHYRRDRNHRCILGYECPPVRCTRPYEVFHHCPSACLAEWCGDKDNQPTACNTLVEHVCDPRCVCRKGHFRDSKGICVPYNKCPPTPAIDPVPYN